MEKIDLIKNIKSRFNILDAIQQRDDLYFISVEKQQAIEVLTFLRNMNGFTHLVLLTAVDWIERDVFQLTYLLNNPKTKTDIGMRVEIKRKNAEMTSAHHLWATIATYQRELKEMFGIDFPGSPRLNEPFILEGWDDIPPYRRDFDTKKYSEETYFPRSGRQTHDPKEYMKGKIKKV